MQLDTVPHYFSSISGRYFLVKGNEAIVIDFLLLCNGLNVTIARNQSNCYPDDRKHRAHLCDAILLSYIWYVAELLTGPQRQYKQPSL
jgi:hypothetical protein